MMSICCQDFCFTHGIQIVGAPNRLANKRCRNVALHQALECIGLVEVRVQPHVEVCWPEHQRNALRVDMAESRVRRKRDHREGVNQVISKPPALPQAGQHRGFTLGVNVVHLLTSPFVKGAHRDDATPARVSLLPERTGGEPIGSGIEGVELGVRPVSGTVCLLLDEQRPNARDQLAAASIVQDKFGRATRWDVKLRLGPVRHSQLVHQLPDHRAVSHIESATHGNTSLLSASSIDQSRRAVLTIGQEKVVTEAQQEKAA